MGKVGAEEKVTQQRVIKLFQEKLNYRYLGDLRKEKNHNVKVDILREYLTRQNRYSENLINKAINKFLKYANSSLGSLQENNKEVYSLLRYSVKERDENANITSDVYLIDWQNPHNNDFAIAEEVTVKGKNGKRPDLVVYINGIAIAVLELKRSKVSVSEGIRQNIDNQQPEFIQSFFNTIQYIIAGNDSQGLYYGTIGTQDKYYLQWKEDTHQDIEGLLDRSLLQIFAPERIIELIHDFIIYDGGIKKLARSHQYLGVKAAQKYVERKEGGIMWHTQGSGKSLTMVWLYRWIVENNHNARVLIITDRTELDAQIASIYHDAGESIYRTENSGDLMNQLTQTHPRLICSLIHKFSNKHNNQDDQDDIEEEIDYDAFNQELQKARPANFQPIGEFFVFVDECHRTQSGKLHQSMKNLLPNAVFIGFTGTPLLKNDKLKSVEVFGKYIHTYKFDQAIADKVVLDLRYEARYIEQYLTSPSKIDQWFEAKTRGLSEEHQAALKRKWVTMQNIRGSKNRQDQIVADIIFDMETKERLKNGRGNALLVAENIDQACQYYELFQQHGFTQCAIISSYKPSIDHLKGENTGSDRKTNNAKKYATYQKMLKEYGYKDTEEFEKQIKDKFVKQPDQMKLLIVVDKLLTGFDAPPATYLYIDKTMKDHRLFQAICRVNRPHGEDKLFGYIIDYKNLFQSLEQSIKDYTGGAFNDYDPQDIQGLLSDYLLKGKEQLDTALEKVKALCEPVPPPKDTNKYIRYFCGNPQNPDDLKKTKPLRLDLYKYVTSLLRAYANIANDMIKAGYTPEEIRLIKSDVKYYEDIRQEIRLASYDVIDLKSYEPDMIYLIDTYIGAKESEKIAAFNDIKLIDIILERGKEEAINQLPNNIKNNPEAVAETIGNNLRAIITEFEFTNPTHYLEMSNLLSELIVKQQTEKQNYEQYLAEIIKICQQVKRNSNYPSSINSPAKQALYDNLDKNEKLALDIDLVIQVTKQDNWRNTTSKQRLVRQAIQKCIKNHGISENLEITTNKIFEIVKQHPQEY